MVARSQDVSVMSSPTRTYIHQDRGRPYRRRPAQLSIASGELSANEEPRALQYPTGDRRLDFFEVRQWQGWRTVGWDLWEPTVIWFGRATSRRCRDRWSQTC